MRELGATCAHTMTDAKRDISKKDWDVLRFGWICSSAASFAQKKIELESLCARPGSCTIAELVAKKKVSSFLDRVNNLSKRIQTKMGKIPEGEK